MLECLKTHELLKQTTTDPLTDLLNQKGLRDQLKIEIERAKRHSRPLCLLMMDVDHFKDINDAGGHLMGDAFAREVANKLRLAVRNIDFIGRYGGDEFLVVLPDTEIVDALMIADRIRSHISEIQISGLKSRPTVSIGLTTLKPDLASVEEMLAFADKALYQAKHRGRDRVEVF